MGEPLRVKQASDLGQFLHQPLGPTAWRQVGQDTINAFAALTNDPQWIHVDPSRAAHELSGRRTIVPGQLLLALLPSLIRETYLVAQAQSGWLAALRYVRFRHAIECDTPFQLCGRLLDVSQRGSTTFVEMQCELVLPDQTVALEANRVDAFRS
ncbi:MaoC/PaaZ C-terminal domain-containing protein (plasmid) [Microvirga sp. RSM25]|uniref:MaoC/PaaZ C-terminal domain-containing protein n=1 Tax=Microvirga sp. RSM25 TaxID=3273802 RepID=UPI00384B3A07